MKNKTTKPKKLKKQSTLGSLISGFIAISVATSLLGSIFHKKSRDELEDEELVDIVQGKANRELRLKD